jgi:predicted amidohydrolase
VPFVIASVLVAGSLDHLLAQSPDAGAYAIENVTVVPMDSERVLPGHTVLVEQGRIAQVGPSGSFSVPPGAVRIDGEGRFLIPGLADMHARLPAQDAPLRVLEVPDALLLYVANGITTVRGMQGAPYQLDLRADIAEGKAMGPTLYVGSPPLDGNSVSDPASVNALVRGYADAGYDLLTSESSFPSVAWDALVAASREAGLSVAGRVPTGVGLDKALQDGITTIDYLDSYLEATRAGPQSAASSLAGWLRSTDDRALADMARATADAGAFAVPVQYLSNHLFGYNHLFGGWVIADSVRTLPEIKYVAKVTRDGWVTSAWDRWSANGINEEAAEAQAAWRKTLLQALRGAGVPILLGSGASDLFSVPGFASLRELSLMVAQGLTPYEALASATQTPARYAREVLDEPGDFGAVIPGNRADLVLLEANPLESIDALGDRIGVMVRGVWHAQEEFDEALAVLAERYKDFDTD